MRALPQMPPRTMVLAAAQGGLGGAIAAVMLGLMHGLQHLIWGDDASRIRIVVTILAGGAILGFIQTKLPLATLGQELKTATDPTRPHRQRLAYFAACGIVSVAFGGAVGPEAGLIAVTSEICGLVSFRIARSHAEQTMLARSATAGALGGLYGAPGGASLYEDDEADLRPAYLLAGIVGALCFIAMHRLTSAPASDLPLTSTRLTASQLVPCILAALIAAAVTALYLALRSALAHLPQHVPSLWLRVLGGSALFGLMAALVPDIRFSGHEDLAHVEHLAHTQAWATLATLAVMKLAATALNLATGWLGGDFFPLLLAGAAAASLSCAMTTLPPSAAMVAGMACATSIVTRKPLVAAVLVLLITAGCAPLATILGAGCALAVTSLLPESWFPAPAGH